MSTSFRRELSQAVRPLMPATSHRAEARGAGLRHSLVMDATLVMGQQGRLVIPADGRAALGLAPRDQLHLHVAGARLILQRPKDAVEELRALAKDVPRSRSFVEEPLEEHRIAAATE